MLATELIRAVEQAGGRLEPDRDGLVVEAPMRLSECEGGGGSALPKS